MKKIFWFIIVNLQIIQAQITDADNLIWDTPSQNEHGSMPIGNGDVGLNVWMEPTGDLLFYISKTDAWDGNGSLLKIGKIKIKNSGNSLISQSITASGDHVDHLKENAFDNNITNKWFTYDATPWIQIELTGPKVINSYTITSAEDVPARDPNSWTLKASNDKSAWVDLDVQSNNSFSARRETKAFAINNTTAFKFIRFEFQNTSGSEFQLSNIGLFENGNNILNSSGGNTPFFKQELNLRKGSIEITVGSGAEELNYSIWVDAYNDVIHVDMDSEIAFDVSVESEIWRTQAKDLGQGEEGRMAYGIQRKPNPAFPIILHPDQVMTGQQDKIVWYHRNTHSIYDTTLSVQGIKDFKSQFPDPLINRTFGAMIKGQGFVTEDSVTLQSSSPTKSMLVSIYPFTSQTSTVDAWYNQLATQVQSIDGTPTVTSRSEHSIWWNRFWDRSWIQVSGGSEAAIVTQGYNLQRWINASGGRGNFAIKYNGSIFTVATKFQPDYRNWGGNYWWQNTRLPYWSMPTSGDYDLMHPMFSMYLRAAVINQARSQRYYNHGGIYFPETMYFWGTHNNANYGWTEQRGGLPEGTTVNQYIRYEWTSSIELTQMMFDYYDNTQSQVFLRDTLLPLAAGVVEWFDNHWGRTNGKIVMDPAQALETIRPCINPTPDVAGLRSIIPRMLDLPAGAGSAVQRAQWQDVLNDVAPIHLAGANPQYMEGCESLNQNKGNSEHPQLYPVFPFTHYSVGRPNLNIGIETWNRRVDQGIGGWRQHAIFAAMLGLTSEAKSIVSTQFGTKHSGSRFPAFWGPNFDWTPDQCHGGVSMMALQRMLLQNIGDSIILMPTWPNDWDVNFKLHAPKNTTIEGKINNGLLTEAKIKPQSRIADVFVGPTLNPIDNGIILNVDPKKLEEKLFSKIKIENGPVGIVIIVPKLISLWNVFDLKGALIHQSNKTGRFELGNLKKGVYQIILFSHENNYIKRIVVY